MQVHETFSVAIRINSITLEHNIDLHAILYLRFYRALTLVEIHF